MTNNRTHLQKEAKDIDLEIFRLVNRLLRLEETSPTLQRITIARRMLDSARIHLHRLMHQEDRERIE